LLNLINKVIKMLQETLERFSPFEQALITYKSVRTSRTFFTAKLLAEGVSTYRELISRLENSGVSASAPIMSRILTEFLERGLVFKNTDGRLINYSAIDNLQYAVNSVCELGKSILADTIEHALTSEVGQILENEGVVEDIKLALREGYERGALEQAISIHNAGTSLPTRFEILRRIADARELIKYRELKSETVADSTLSTVLAGFRALDMVRGTAEEGYVITKAGKHLTCAVFELESRIASASINERLDVARRGGASEKALEVYQSALERR